MYQQQQQRLDAGLGALLGLSEWWIEFNKQKRMSLLHGHGQRRKRGGSNEFHRQKAFYSDLH
jgi:outer membrane biogenesis lipoprotein LolB